MMRRTILVLLLAAAWARADDYAGTFEHPQIVLVLKAAAGGYEGTLTVQGTAYPAKAAVRDGRLEGSFTVRGTSFAFTAERDGDALKLTSGGKTHELKRKAEAVNPLGGVEGPAPEPAPNPQPQNPEPQPQPAGPQQPSTPTAGPVLEALRNLAPRQEDPSRLWTILVYLAADNDLEPPGVADLNEMEAGIPASGVEVIVLMDRAQGFSNADGDWTDARVYRIRQDGNPETSASPILKKLGEINMGDPAVLAAFVEGGLKAFPAKRTMLVMWDHGGGWAGMAMDDDDGAGGHDQITLPELGAGMAAGLRAAGVPRLDIIAFDMCLMAQLETAVEMAPLARVLVASQALEPGTGWPYDRVLPLFADPRADAKALGVSVCRVFDAYYDELGDETTTCSCIDLEGTPRVVQALNALTEKLRPAMAQHWPTAARALFFSESYMSRSDFRNGPKGVNSLDLMDVFKRVRHNLKPFPAEAEFDAFEKAYAASVLASVNNEQRRLSTGLAIYAPVTAKAVNPEYAATALARGSAWPAFLGEIHRLQARDTTPPKVGRIRVTDEEGNAIGAVKPLAGHQFEGVIEGKNIIWTIVLDGVRDAGLGGVKVFAKSILLDDLWILRYEEAQKNAVHDLDLLLPQYKDGETKVRTEFDGLLLAVTDGQDRADATFDVSSVDGSGVFTFPALLEHAALGDKPVLATMVVDGFYWNVVGIVVHVPTPDGRVQVKKVDPSQLPGDVRVKPLQELVRDDGTTDFVTGGDLYWGQGLRCRVEVMPAGDYEALLRVETMGDVAAGARFPYKVEDDPELAQGVQGWQAYKPEQMIGTWDLFFIGEDGGLVPRPRTYTLDRHPQLPGAFLAQVRDTESPDENHEQIWIIDTGGFPHIRMIVLEDGKETGLLTVPALFGIVDSKAKMVGKMLDVGGMLWVWVKRGTVQSDLERIQPVDTPEPEPLR